MTKKKSKTNKILIIISIFLICVSVGFFAFPSVSRWLTQERADNLTDAFDNRQERVEDVLDGLEGLVDATDAVKTDTNSDGKGSDDGKEDDGKEDDAPGYYEGSYGYDVYYDRDDTGGWSDYDDSYLKELMAQLYKDSAAYNDSLKKRQDFSIPWTYSALNLKNYGIYDGMYGYLSIPKVGVNQPIYLGATEGNMAYGVTHLMSTSLPIGGESTNCVLSGHTGYIGRYFFDSLPDLDKGDKVYIKNYFGKLEYQVTGYRKVGPTDTSDMYIERGKDKLTMFTCIDWGKNRYVVTCERVK